MPDTIRIFELPIDEIIIDPEGCSGMLNRTLKRTGRKVAGICTDGTRVFVSLTPDAGMTGTFRFAELAPPERNHIDAEISARYTAGFIAIGSFPTAENIWALFCRLDDNTPAGSEGL